MELQAAALRGGGVAPATVTLSLSGMGCEACELAVRNILGSSPSVLGSEADFRSGEAKVLVQPGFDVAADPTLRKLLADDGYELLSQRAEGARAEGARADDL